MKSDIKIKTHNLSFDYRTKIILRDISLEVRPGDFIGLLGPNGCGKTTLMKNLIGLLEPSAGIVTLDNRNLSSYSIKEISNMLGYVPQRSALSMPLLVRDFLLNACYSQLQKPLLGYTHRDERKVRDIAEQVNIEHFLNTDILTLSGGETQRVMLARALIKCPRVLFLDEPTSALDLNYAIEMLSICDSLTKKNVSVVSILHDLNLASLFCHKVVMLRGGTIRYIGTPDELYTPEILLDIYNLRCEVITHIDRKIVVPLR